MPRHCPNPRRRPPPERLALILSALVTAGCGGPKAYVREGFLEHAPRRVAVLPFVITYPYDLTADQMIPESHRVGREVFRKTFYYALTPYGFEDVKLADVDERLASAWGPVETGQWQQATPQALGQTVGADALIYGDIKRVVHMASPLYTETSLEASVRMVEAATGEVLWRKPVKVAERGGALVQKGQIVDFVKDQVRSFNPSVKFLRVSDQAVRQLMNGFPNPPWRGEGSAAASASQRAEAGSRRLAILPFDAAHAPWRQASRVLRDDLTASLQEGPWDVVEIQQVNAALEAQGWRDGEPLPSALSLSRLAETIGADLLLRGTVTDWGRTYLVVQSWVKAELQLDLVEAKSETVIWSEKRKNTRQAGLLKGPTGYKSLATAPIMGLKTGHLERVAMHLARSMADDLKASPAVLAYLSEQPR